MKAIFAILLLAVGLTGCGTTQPKPPAERVVYRYIRVPSEMTQKVLLASPPNPVAYSSLSCDVKEKTLMDLLQERTTEVGIANTRLEGVDAWSAKQAKIYEAAP
jgi:hypothetical protein